MRPPPKRDFKTPAQNKLARSHKRKARKLKAKAR
jgi:hypothetical protein